MDRVIEKKIYNKKKILIILMIIAVAASGTYSLVSFWGDSSSVDKDKIRIGSVKRGAFNVLVQGSGVVVAKDPEWIVSKVPGQVVTLPHKAGDSIKKGEILVKLINEDIVSSLVKSESEQRALNADFSVLKVTLQSQQADLKSNLLMAELNYRQASAVLDALTKIKEKGAFPIPELEYINAVIKVEQTKGMVEIAKVKLKSFEEIEKTQLEAFNFRLASVREENLRLRNQVNELNVIATKDGILQDFNLKAGQAVGAGDSIAQIIDQSSVYVTLNIPAVHAFKLLPDQKVDITLNRKNIQGTVYRIDPNIKGSTIAVDVYFDKNVQDAKIGMFVNGTIFVKSIVDSLFIDIPSNAAENSKISIFVLSSDRGYANKIAVESGLSSANYLQIVKGLTEGDEVILSDVPNLKNANRLRLN